MASTFPLPVRVAVGVLATGLERLRQLPQDLPALSVTVAGHAVRTSMRLQQEIAELAGRGDEVLAGATSQPSERPAWARFDDEDDQQDGGVDAPDAAHLDASEDGLDTGHGDPEDAGLEANQGGDDVPAADTEQVAGPGTTAADADPDPDPTPDMPGYSELRIAQVRARLRALDADAVARLLEHEQRTTARAPFVTLLTNRLTTLQADAPDPRA